MYLYKSIISLFFLLALSLLGCAAAEAQCPGGNCSVGVWSPWGGAWYYASPCAGGRCAAKPAAEPEEPDLFRDLTKMVEEPASDTSVSSSDIVEFKPFCLRVLELINAQRQAAGLAPFTLDVSLCNGCESHSAWMQRNGFQHAYYGGRECIAYGVRTPEAVVNLWLNSSGHRAIILGSGKILGVGCSGSFWTLRVR